MLSIGWTEMLLVAAIALIVVGPKDLPAMLRQIGKFVSSARRMGNDFKKELNKVAAIDEIRDIKKSFTEPLNETRSKIESEFNSITPDGKIVPSGIIKPTDPNAESVVDEIRNAAGMGPSPADNVQAAQAARDSIASAVTKAAQRDEAVAVASAKTTRTKAVANKAKAKSTSAKSGSDKSGSAKPEAKPAPKPRARRASPKPAAVKPVVAKSAPAKPRTAKPAATKPAATKPVATRRARRKPAPLAAVVNAPDDK